MIPGVKSREDLDRISASTRLPLVVGGIPASMCDPKYLASRRVRLAVERRPSVGQRRRAGAAQRDEVRARGHAGAAATGRCRQGDDGRRHRRHRVRRTNPIVPCRASAGVPTRRRAIRPDCSVARERIAAAESPRHALSPSARTCSSFSVGGPTKPAITRVRRLVVIPRPLPKARRYTRPCSLPD